MKPHLLLSLGIVYAASLVSGCSGNDPGSIIPPSGPTASAEDQHTPQSDVLTSQEAALVSHGNSEPIPAAKPDL